MKPTIVAPGEYPLATRRCSECQRAYAVRVDRGGQQPVTCGEDCRRQRARRVSRLSRRRRERIRNYEANRAIAQALGEKVPVNSSRRSSLDPHEIVSIQIEMAEAIRGDHTADRLAQRYGVEPRTIDRYASLGMPEIVRIGRHFAWFASRKRGTGTPVQLTEWAGVQAAPDDEAR